MLDFVDEAEEWKRGFSCFRRNAHSMWYWKQKGIETYNIKWYLFKRTETAEMQERWGTRCHAYQDWTSNHNSWIVFEHLMHPNVDGTTSYQGLMALVLADVQRHLRRFRGLQMWPRCHHKRINVSKYMFHVQRFEEHILMLIQAPICFASWTFSCRWICFASWKFSFR
jgi:hypothetical protein